MFSLAAMCSFTLQFVDAAGVVAMFAFGVPCAGGERLSKPRTVLLSCAQLLHLLPCWPLPWLGQNTWCGYYGMVRQPCCTCCAFIGSCRPHVRGWDSFPLISLLLPLSYPRQPCSAKAAMSWKGCLILFLRTPHAGPGVCETPFRPTLRILRSGMSSTRPEEPASMSLPFRVQRNGASRPFACSECGPAFRLRKHLAVHQARSRARISPARLYAVVAFCLACQKWYHSITRVQ